jgi:SAM-dependent methyltransferase
LGVDSDSLQSAAVFWNAAAETYEQKFSGTITGQARRQAVWQDLGRAFQPGQRVLELNCGTGIDAVFLAGRGVRVLACDIAPRMIELAQDLAESTALETRPDFRVLATENLSLLRDEGPFDGAFSNFAGLNCVADLSKVAKDLGELLKPGARFLMCVRGRFVPWEIVWYLAHGRPREAFLRLHHRSVDVTGVSSIEVRHPAVAEVAEQMGAAFQLRRWKGVGITVPPSCMEHWAKRFPRLMDRLARIDRRIGDVPLFRSMADGVFLEFERRGDA